MRVALEVLGLLFGGGDATYYSGPKTRYSGFRTQNDSMAFPFNLPWSTISVWLFHIPAWTRADLGKGKCRVKQGVAQHHPLNLKP